MRILAIVVILVISGYVADQVQIINGKITIRPGSAIRIVSSDNTQSVIAP